MGTKSLENIPRIAPGISQERDTRTSLERTPISRKSGMLLRELRGRLRSN